MAAVVAAVAVVAVVVAAVARAHHWAAVIEQLSPKDLHGDHQVNRKFYIYLGENQKRSRKLES